MSETGSFDKQEKTEETLKLQPQAVGRKGQGVALAELLNT